MGQFNLPSSTTFMKEPQTLPRKHDAISSQPFWQPFEPPRNSGTVKERQPSCASIAEQFAIDPATGQLFMHAPGLELRFPMVVVRHGETDGNVCGMFQGRIENPLNVTGKAQAEQAAQQLYAELTDLLGEQFTALASAGKLIVLTSPLSRAQDTAQAFIGYVQRQIGIVLDMRVEEALAEICFGAIEGQTLESIADEQLRSLALRYRAQEAMIDWHGTGESFCDVIRRAKGLLERLNGQYGRQKVVVIGFAHGILINALRTVVGDRTLVEENGHVAFRKHIIANAEAYWLGHSRELAAQLFHNLRSS